MKSIRQDDLEESSFGYSFGTAYYFFKRLHRSRPRSTCRRRRDLLRIPAGLLPESIESIIHATAANHTSRGQVGWIMASAKADNLTGKVALITGGTSGTSQSASSDTGSLSLSRVALTEQQGVRVYRYRLGDGAPTLRCQRQG